MTNESEQRRETTMGRLVSTNMLLKFDTAASRAGLSLKGARSRNLPGFSFSETNIVGRRAEIVSWQVPTGDAQSEGNTHAICLNFPANGSKPGLRLVAYCRNDAAYPLAKEIFDTIEFKQK